MKRTAILIVGILILVGLAVLLRPTPQTPAAPAPAPSARTSTANPAPVAQTRPPAHSFDIVVGQGRRVSGPELVRVQAGDEVVLRVTSDRADELHLHGYDLHLQLRPGEPGTLAFHAVHSGHFDYELHHAQLELGAVEVLPQ